MQAARKGPILILLALVCSASLAAQTSTASRERRAADDLLPPEAEPVTPPDTASQVRTLKAAKPGVQGPPTGFRLKVDVNLVLVDATVRDPRGGMVDNLERQDFHVSEDGVEQQIRYFSRDELPLAVVLVVDRSSSMAPVLRELRRAAYDALRQLKPQDQVAMFAFAARPELMQRLTPDRARVADQIARVRAAGTTVITDALYEAAEYLAEAAPARRHAIILISDNENTLEGYTNQNKVIRLALETETVIYSVKIGEGMESHTHGWPVLLPLFRDVSVPTIARETGGEVIEARNSSTLESAIAAVVARLRQRYTLGYQSTNHRHDGAFRTIEIRVSGSSAPSSRCIVYARRGYYAPREPSIARSPEP